MDVVLVGLPGSGKSAVGRRLAHRHGASFVDLDDMIEKATGQTIPAIFAEQGEAAFRALERKAVADLGPADGGVDVRLVVATGGGAVIDPRNRWDLYRGRVPVWLDVRPEVLAQRLRRSPNVRPLIVGRDPMGAIRDLARDRDRFYSAAHRMNGVAELASIVERIDELVARVTEQAEPTVLLRGRSLGGDLVIGEGIAASTIADALRGLRARRAIFISEPGAWTAAGEAIAAAFRDDGWPVERVLLPQGEAAKRLTVVETAAGELAGLHVERGEPLIALGGGALGDAAGFLAASWLRGVPFIQVPTTLVAQVDSAIGGKTGVDLPAGKNLVGAFHPPAAIVIDIALLRSLPERQRRAALGEAAKMAALGDERLFALLERDGSAIARDDPATFEDGAVAELVERTAWAKVAIVDVDEKEHGAADGRITLNLGHSLGHAVEAAGGFADLLHGEAVAHGLRGAIRIGRELGMTPPDRAERIERLLTDLGLATERLPYPLDSVLAALAADKKHADGALRWVLPTADGSVVRSDVPADVVERAAASLLVPGAIAAAEAAAS
jgi:shikimate kinase / 3-dehydroquinate synthase